MLFVLFLMVTLFTMGTQGRPIPPPKGSAEATVAHVPQSRSFDWTAVKPSSVTMLTIVGIIGLIVLAGICICCYGYLITLKEYVNQLFQQLVGGVVQNDIEALLHGAEYEGEHHDSHHHETEHQAGEHWRDRQRDYEMEQRYNTKRNGKRETKLQQKPSIRKLVKKPIQKVKVSKFVPKMPKIALKIKKPKFMKRTRR